jgi:hypothetical protein
MRTISLFAISFLLSLKFDCQTAVNWTVNDCQGNSHELFEDLDAGKAVVIVWVMPCSNCINGALTAQTEVQNALAANPGKVIYYVADDYANTSCATLASWASSNGITAATLLSHSSVSMSGYGSSGMPKVVVLGGSSHKVFYNQNAPNISATGIRDAIIQALATPVSVNEKDRSGFAVSVFPNPSGDACNIKLELPESRSVHISIMDFRGQVVTEIFNGVAAPGVTAFSVDTSDFSAGVYLISFSDGNSVRHERIVVSR